MLLKLRFIAAIIALAPAISDAKPVTLTCPVAKYAGPTQSKTTYSFVLDEDKQLATVIPVKGLVLSGNVHTNTVRAIFVNSDVKWSIDNGFIVTEYSVDRTTGNFSVSWDGKPTSLQEGVCTIEDTKGKLF